MPEELQRDYNMSDSDLCMFTTNLVQNITRDATEFATRSVDALAVTALENLGNLYEVFPPDSYYQADVSLAVQNKDAKREELELAVRAVVQCAVIKWGEGSPQYRKFGAQKMTAMGDAKFLTMCRLVVTTATGFLADLTASGLSQAMITAVDTDAQTYEDYMAAVINAVEVRDIKTAERITDGNALYAFVVQYCKIGKIIWSDISEAKYNDYILYNTVHSGLSKPQNLTAVEDAVDPLKVLIDFDVVAGATEYRLYKSETEIGHTSGDYTQISVSATNHFDTPLIPGKRNYWKVRAYSADKKSDYSDEVYIDG